MKAPILLSSIRRKFNATLKDPGYAAAYALSRTLPGVFRCRYVRQARKVGISGKYLLLSFDCDTEKDIEVVQGVHQRLGDLGIVPSYAVPGELLKHGRATYRGLMESGAEFINHGYLSHTAYTEATRSYVSTVFYDQLTDEEVRRDVIQGHDTCAEVLGKYPEGFRTPHFGTYQRPGQLKHLYAVLSELGYRFSSSTTPVTGMWHGPIKSTGTPVVELPVSGCYDYPARILDSWNFRFSPTRRLTERDYIVQFKKIVDFYHAPENVGVLNIYADPSQVYDWPAFFECMAMTHDFRKVSFGKLVDEVCE
jgi:hypothetical protein